MSSLNNSAFKKYFDKNGRAMGSMGYFLLLMIVFLIGAPEAWIRPNLHQSVFVMMPTLLFMVIPLVFLVTSGEIDLSFASTYGLSAYVFCSSCNRGGLIQLLRLLEVFVLVLSWGLLLVHL